MAFPETANQVGNTLFPSVVNPAWKAPRFNVHDLRLAGPMKQLSLPSPYESALKGNVEHAYGTPIYFAEKWNGYKWWMVGAPYPTRARGTCTISNGSPAIITYVNHPFQIGAIVTFSTTGALPTGLTAGTIYYVVQVNFAADTFSVSLTPGGTPVNTSSAGSGVHTAIVYAPRFENPVIYVSNDEETWIRCPGAQSPLFATNSLFSLNNRVSYYADPYLTYDPVSNKLYLIWCWFSQQGTTKSSLLVSESSDGCTWTSPVEVFRSTSTTFTPNSPSLLRTSTGWKCIAVDTRDGTGTFSFIVSSTNSDTPYSGWAAPGAVFNDVWTQSTAVNPLTRQWWHQYSVIDADDNILMMASDNASTGGAAYTLESIDGGLTYTVYPFSAWNTASALGIWYRPGLCVCSDSADLELRLYASMINAATTLTGGVGFYMKSAPLKQDFSAVSLQSMLLRDAVHRQLTAPVALRRLGLLFWDSFNRANVAAAGTSDCGIAWTQVDANTIGIDTNRAYNSNANNCRAYFDTGSLNYDFEIQVVTVGTQWNLIFGYIDANNFWRFGSSVGSTGLQRIVAGAISTEAPSGWTSLTPVSDGDILRISKRGERYTLFWNDRPIDSFVDTTSFATSTIVGLQASGASPTYFDNCIVRTGV